MELLTTVFGVTEISQFISFEDQVHLDHTSFMESKSMILLSQLPRQHCGLQNHR